MHGMRQARRWKPVAGVALARVRPKHGTGRPLREFDKKRVVGEHIRDPGADPGAPEVAAVWLYGETQYNGAEYKDSPPEHGAWRKKRERSR